MRQHRKINLSNEESRSNSRTSTSLSSLRLPQGIRESRDPAAKQEGKRRSNENLGKAGAWGGFRVPRGLRNLRAGLKKRETEACDISDSGPRLQLHQRAAVYPHQRHHKFTGKSNASRVQRNGTIEILSRTRSYEERTS